MCTGVQINESLLLLFIPLAGSIDLFGDSSDRSNDIDILYNGNPEKAVVGWT